MPEVLAVEESSFHEVDSEVEDVRLGLTGSLSLRPGCCGCHDQELSVFALRLDLSRVGCGHARRLSVVDAR